MWEQNGWLGSKINAASGTGDVTMDGQFAGAGGIEREKPPQIRHHETAAENRRPTEVGQRGLVRYHLCILGGHPPRITISLFFRLFFFIYA